MEHNGGGRLNILVRDIGQHIMTCIFDSVPQVELIKALEVTWQLCPDKYIAMLLRWQLL